MNTRKVARTLARIGVCLALHPVGASAAVTKVVITSQGVVAGGQSFGTTGAYEKLEGRIEFALDPADAHTRGITDLAFATKGPSIEERYRGVDDYRQRIRSAAMDLIRRRYLLPEDLDSIVERAKNHWTFATREEGRRSAERR